MESTIVRNPFLRVMVDQQYLLDRLAEIRQGWETATNGEMEKVTLDLSMLLDDMENLIKGNLP